jgi:F-type H+-transporting ATPase subunit b
MKSIDFCHIKRLSIFFGVLLLIPELALASGPAWRPTYDTVMMWVNFFILAGIILKYAREPIKNFLKQKKAEVVAELDELEAEKARILGDIKSADTQALQNKQRLKEMKERLIAQGEIKKGQIIEQAKQQSAIMIEATRKKMENRIVQAHNTLKMELADMAFEQALKQLPGIIDDQDNQRLLDRYMDGMHQREPVV